MTQATMAVAAWTVLALACCWMTGGVQSRVVDLTHVHDENCLYWPINRAFEMEDTFTGLYKGKVWISTKWFGTAEHSGTHMDAPRHFLESGKTVDQLSPENLVGPGVVIDIRDKVAEDVSYSLSVEDLEAWEREHGQIPKGAIVLMNSGWSARYSDKRRAFNSDKLDDTSTFTFPGFSHEAIQWLLAHRDANIIGVDSPSLDASKNKGFRVHVDWLGAGKLGLEYVANLNALPPSGSTVMVGTMKLGKGTGAPARILALVHDDHDEASHRQHRGAHGSNGDNASASLEPSRLAVVGLLAATLLALAAGRVGL